MRKKRGKPSFVGRSKNLLFALLVVAAAVTVYGIAQAATVSHSGSEIQGNVKGADNSQLLGGDLSAADIREALAAAGGGGGYASCYAVALAENTATPCEAGFEAVLSSSGTGCVGNSNKYLFVNLGDTKLLGIATAGSFGVLYEAALIEGTEWLKVICRDQSDDLDIRNFPSTVAWCCK